MARVRRCLDPTRAKKLTSPEYSSSLDAEATDEEDGTLGAREAYWRFGDSFVLANKGLNSGTMWSISIHVMASVEIAHLLSDSSKVRCCF